MQPLSHTCTCSQVQNDLSCTNDCISQASQSSIEHTYQVPPSPNQAQDTRTTLQEVKKLKQVESVLQMQR
jgi:hypothetical protein